MRIMDIESGLIFYEDLPEGRFKDNSCGEFEIKFVEKKPVLKEIMERKSLGGGDYSWQSLPI